MAEISQKGYLLNPDRRIQTNQDDNLYKETVLPHLIRNQRAEPFYAFHTREAEREEFSKIILHCKIAVIRSDDENLKQPEEHEREEVRPAGK